MIQKKKKKISLFGRERMAGEAKKHGCNQRSIRVCVRAAGAAVWTSHSPRRGDYSRIDLLQHTPAHRQEESPYRIIPRVGPLHQLAERCAHPAPPQTHRSKPLFVFGVNTHASHACLDMQMRGGHKHGAPLFGLSRPDAEPKLQGYVIFKIKVRCSQNCVSSCS